ncbi:glycerol-3-phosphate dehydrogenase/oxidase [Actinoallomurus iriomotensis]|uniref:Glycerol-3-phosphate dehydrogenase n=1 Tax=Actinoallomurus iriomotensis TaxID=478107 RepID=A0A9W6W5B4_9ACTN|nr:glycerol-3-phosphate dehydrogenase/oxidase [Actinoallomurus iriomotensis]GLY89871.1 FAD-dependent oxidoreductase [Actinoallomurus iriomotensis]
MKPASLGPADRARAVRELADQEFDVLVVGGGVVGAGAALDAVSRGLSVALVEAADWAAGTSSRSSKLIHGGLRYLEQRDFHLVREALRERALLLTRVAPHLVHPVPFLYPLKHRMWERFYVGAGIGLYDTMGGAGAVPRHRHLSHRHALRVAPALRGDAFVGAIQYFDAQVDDARFTMTLARTAASYGATVVSRARATGFVREGERVTGARVHDLENDREITVRAREVINATGVWTDETHRLAGARGDVEVRASKGVHLLVPRDRIRLDTGLIMRTEKSVLFVIPWGRHWIIGTTDTAWELAKDEPAASGADVDYLLDHVNSVLTIPLTHDDIEAVYAGLRPLLSGGSDETTKLSREHTVSQPLPGLTVIAGGKFTTYRVMAEDVVDAVAGRLPLNVPDSVTHRLPLAGAVGYEVLWNDRRRLAARAGLHVARIEHLLNRYGSCVDEVLTLIEGDPSLGEPIPAASDYLKAEAVYAVTHEGALHLEDVLRRRLRASMEEWDQGAAAAPEVAGLIAPILGWDDETAKRETENYVARVQAELQARREQSDTAAAAALHEAPSLFPDRAAS